MVGCFGFCVAAVWLLVREISAARCAAAAVCAACAWLLILSEGEVTVVDAARDAVWRERRGAVLFWKVVRVDRLGKASEVEEVGEEKARGDRYRRLTLRWADGVCVPLTEAFVDVSPSFWRRDEGAGVEKTKRVVRAFLKTFA